MSGRREEIAEGLASVHGRIDAARAAAGRSDGVELVVVTKTFPADDVRILAELGVLDVGENRDQEAAVKRQTCGDLPMSMRWHMIGQLQRNKAASVARWADVVESVDRAALVPVLDRAAAAAGRRLEVLIQVSLDPEPNAGRGGAAPADVLVLAEQVVASHALDLRGVMGVAPYPGDPAVAFARLRRIADEVAQRWPEAWHMSAGMSGDLEEAIAEGATHVRVGGAVLGARSAVQ